MGSDVGEDIKRFAAECRKVDDKLIRRQINKRLKHVADEGVSAAKAAALAIPSHGEIGRHYFGKGAKANDHVTRSQASLVRRAQAPLRGLLASAVVPKWRSSGKESGVSVNVSRARLPVGRQGAEKVIEFGGRHKVYGRNYWVKQEAHPWFHRALEPIRGKALVELRKVMDDIADEVGFK